MEYRHTDNLDQLVATYAPIGRQQRRGHLLERARKLGYTAVAAAVCVGAGAVLLQLELPDRLMQSRLLQSQQALDSVETQLQQAELLRSQLANELATISAQRLELADNRRLLAEQKAALVVEAEALAGQRQALEVSQQELDARGRVLADAAAEAEQRQRALDARRAAITEEGPALELAMAELAERRASLDDERKRFRAQRELLEHEIGLLNQQKATLEAQQRELRSQWEMLQELLSKVEQSRQEAAARQAYAAGQEASDPAPAEAVDVPVADDLPAAESLIAAADRSIADDELGEIRGGIDIGGPLDITIGLTRAVDINGIEQYSNSFQLSNMNAADLKELAAFETVVIQNGEGNTVDSSALGAYAGGLPIFIQNSLDDQLIRNTNVLDITIGNVASKAAGIAADVAISDSLSFQK